jgi:hypothetical protein
MASARVWLAAAAAAAAGFGAARLTVGGVATAAALAVPLAAVNGYSKAHSP